MTDEEILEAYEEHDSLTEPMEDFLKRVGLSRSGFYGLLRRHRVTPKIRRNDGDPASDRVLLQDIRRRLTHIEELLEKLT